MSFPCLASIRGRVTTTSTCLRVRADFGVGSCANQGNFLCSCIFGQNKLCLISPPTILSFFSVSCVLRFFLANPSGSAKFLGSFHYLFRVLRVLMTAILLAPLLFLNLIAGFKTNGLPTSYPRVSTRLARVSSSSLSSASSALVPLEEALQRLDLQYQNNNPGGGLSGWRTLSDGETYVYVPESVPGCVVTFVGGAVLGKFPHISYNAFLKSLAEEACAIVIAPSYDLGVDHDKIAQDCERMLREGLREIKEVSYYMFCCEERMPILFLFLAY